LAEIELAGLLVDQEIELEIAAIALLAQLLAEAEGEVAGFLADARGEGVGEDLIAAPSALVWGQLGEADQLRHQRTDDGAGSRGPGLDRRLAAVDALHDLELALGGDLLLVALPVRLAGDEEGRVAGIAIGRLDHEIPAEILGRLAQLGIAVDGGEHIR